MSVSLTKNQLTIIIIALVACAILGIKNYVDSSRGQLSDSDLQKIKGAEDAPIQIVEFIDFQCPACAAGSMFLKKYMEEKPGVIRLQMKYYPLRMHSHALLAAQFAECAGRQDKFWPFHDMVIEQQRKWIKLISVRPAFELFAEDIKLNMDQLKSCLGDNSINEVINAHKAEGAKLGVKSTPTYFVNDKLVVGIRSLQTEIKKILDDQEN